MQVSRPRISRIYSDAVAEVTASGVALTADDYAWLWELSRATVDVGRDIPEILSMPVRVGKVAFYPYTLGAYLWWRNAEAWFSDGVEQIIAMAWLLAHSDPADSGRAFRGAGSKFTARAAVWAWLAMIPWNITVEHLERAVSAVLGYDDAERIDLPAPGEMPPKPRPTVADYGRYIIRLCAQSNKTPDEIIWGMAANSAAMLADADRDGRVRDISEGKEEFAALRAGIEYLKKRAKTDAAKETVA